MWRARAGWSSSRSSAAAFGLSDLDPNFNTIATKPDNVPIVGMIFLVGFFFWFSMNQAYENDSRIAAGRAALRERGLRRRRSSPGPTWSTPS